MGGILITAGGIGNVHSKLRRTALYAVFLEPGFSCILSFAAESVWSTDGGGPHLALRCLVRLHLLLHLLLLLLLVHASTKTTEIYTHVSTKHIGMIMSPLDHLEL